MPVSTIYSDNRTTFFYPKEVYGEDLPVETFRVMMENEIREYGEYRTCRLVLETRDRLDGVEVGNPHEYRVRETASKPTQEASTIPQESIESESVVTPKEPS